jgi:H/ACA ribonucleoprotein complex subunit 4
MTEKKIPNLHQFDDLIILRDDATDYRYGYKIFERPINELLEYGIVLIDKPSGPSSHEVASWVKRILIISKTGHSGTLDPGATGLLPMGLGEGTKALSVLLIGPKEYYSVARLHSHVTGNMIDLILKEVCNDIYQKPPQRSSVKRMTRIRKIYELESVEYNDRLFLLRILCQAGTYIRKLIYDIGEVLGPGATMIELRRTRVNSFFEKDGLIKLHELHSAYSLYKENNEEEKLRTIIKPIEECLTDIPSVIIRDTAVDALCHGAQLAIPGISKISKQIEFGGLVGVYTLKGEIVGLAESMMSTKQILLSKNGIAFIMKRIIMKPNTYPKGWK